MTETTARIRWEPLSSGLLLGYVTPGRWLFQIYKTSDDADGTELALMSHLPGQTGDYRYADDPGELKRAAEDWLAGFVSSLGAVFPEPASELEEDGEPLEVRWAAGRRVRYAHADAGYPCEREDVADCLTFGEVYTITWADIGRSRTDLNLSRDGKPRGRFNSVFFEPADDGTSAPRAGED